MLRQPRGHNAAQRVGRLMDRMRSITFTGAAFAPALNTPLRN